MPRRAVPDFDWDEVVRLLKLRYEWKDVARLLGTTPKTPSRWRKRVGFPDFDEVPLAELDAMMLHLTQYYPRIGIRMAASYFLKNGYLLTRSAVMYSLRRLDPSGELRKARKRKRLRRRVYHAGGPHHSWHQDGKEKLRPVGGFYIHGCIDGFSRLPIYLVIADNKHAQVVTECFIDATRRLDVQPLKVIGDHKELANCSRVLRTCNEARRHPCARMPLCQKESV